VEKDPEGKHTKLVVMARAAIDAWKGTTESGEEPHQKPKPGPQMAKRTITDGGDRVFSLHLDGWLSSVEQVAFDGGRA